MKTIKDEPIVFAVLAILLGVAALWAVGCGGGGAYSTPTTPSASGTTTASGGAAASVTVNIVGSAGSGAFSPNPATAAVGQTLAFKNNDGTTHRMVADNGSWDTGNVTPGSTSATVPVSSATALTFHCTIHPSMVGTISGGAALSGPTPDASGGYDY
jgi:plastocyanin